MDFQKFILQDKLLPKIYIQGCNPINMSTLPKNMKKPEFYKTEPKKEYTTKTLVKETRIYDGYEIDEIQKSDPSNIIELDVRHPRDRDESDEYFLVEYRIDVNQNKEYEYELAEYNKAKAKYEEDCVLYKEFLRQQAFEKASKDKENRRRLYEELRNEFEK